MKRSHLQSSSKRIRKRYNFNRFIHFKRFKRFKHFKTFLNRYHSLTQIQLHQLSTSLKKYVKKISLCQNSNFSLIKLIFSIFKLLFSSTHKIKIKNNLILILIFLNLMFDLNSNSIIKTKVFSMFNEESSLSSSFNPLFKLWINITAIIIMIGIHSFSIRDPIRNLIRDSLMIVTTITTIITTIESQRISITSIRITMTSMRILIRSSTLIVM